MQALVDYANSMGFSIENPQLDDRIHRFDIKKRGDKRGWYIGKLCFNHAGESYVVCTFGDWAFQGAHHTFIENKNKKGFLNDRDKTAIKRDIELSRQKTEAEKKILQGETAVKAQKEWENSSTPSQHPYITKKKIEPIGIRQIGETLLVPAMDIEGTMWGLQRIFKDGKKFFMSGQKISGCFMVIGEITEHTKNIYFCEGYATGASIYLALGLPSVVCFNSGNLPKVAKEFRKKHPILNFIICGDNDYDTWIEDHKTGKKIKVNPGEKAAKEAALQSQAKYVLPEGIKGTDFNDLHCERSLEAVKDQILNNKQDDQRGVIPLGYDGNVYIFYNNRNKKIVKVTTFSETEILRLMKKEILEKRYGNEKGKIDFFTAKSDLMTICEAVGDFDSNKVRGVGAWQDNSQIVINTGYSLIIDGDECDYFDFTSEYYYVGTKYKMELCSDKVLEKNDARKLIDAVLSLNWKRTQDPFLLLGWLAICRIAGALPIRPHVWLTGEAGAGKSYVLNQIIINTVQKDSVLFAQWGSTEAGIRQEIDNNSIPIIFDEFEVTSKKSSDIIESILELMRQSWSHTQGGILKGSQSGLATRYNLSFPALVSSIRVSLTNDADRSRFSVLELKKSDNKDPEEFQRLVNKIEGIPEDLPDMLFNRSVKLFNNTLENFKIIRKILAQAVDARFADQNGMLLAGYCSLMTEGIITEEIAQRLIEKSGILEDEEDTDKETDQESCLDYLLSNKIRYSDGDRYYDVTIEEAINLNTPDANDELARNGILFEDDMIFVQTGKSHPQLLKIFRNTRWSKNWGDSLGRIHGAEKSGRKYFFGKQKRVVGVQFLNKEDNET